MTKINVKLVIRLLLMVLLVLVFVYRDLISYGISQGIGQGKIIWNARPISDVLADSSVSDSIKKQINLVQDIRKYAFDSLEIHYSDNYTTYFDQKKKPILWIVTACKPFELQAKEWDFPVVGRVAYKGFFDLDKAKLEAAALILEGYDTSIDEVAGWSTLGWFKDPILSSMLERNVGSLANLIIHELTHGTLFVKDNVDFNENLASFVGDYGAEQFLKQRFKNDEEPLKKYQRRKDFHKKYSELVLLQSEKLDSIYKKINTNTSTEEKNQVKNNFFGYANFQLKALYHQEGLYYNGLDSSLAKNNNTFYMDVKRYRAKQNTFEEEFRTKYRGDFKSYMNHLKSSYPSL